MPKTVAIIGASTDRRKYGNKAVRAFARQGYRVVAIHPRAAAIEGAPAYRSILDVPIPVDMASFYVPPAVGLRVIEEVAQKGVPEVWLNPGAESPELVARARALGLEPVLACSIVGIGDSPGRY
jgi:predicted CoA-binding protein